MCDLEPRHAVFDFQRYLHPSHFLPAPPRRTEAQDQSGLSRTGFSLVNPQLSRPLISLRQYYATPKRGLRPLCVTELFEQDTDNTGRRIFTLDWGLGAYLNVPQR